MSVLPPPAQRAIPLREASKALAQAQSLGEVSILAVTGSFANGVLSSFGDSLDNNLSVSRDAAVSAGPSPA